VPKDELH